MLRLNKFLVPLMQKLDLYQPCRERAALVIWPEVVGPYVAPNTAAVGIKRGVLFVRTASNAWLAELSMGYRRSFIERLNARLGEEVVKEIRFLPPPLPVAESTHEPDAPSLELQALASEDEALVEEVVAGVEAPELRHRLRRLMRRDLALRRARLRAGWRPCQRCEVLTPDGGVCVPCAEERRKARRGGIYRTLLRAPWSSPIDIKARFPDTSLHEYQQVKARLLHGLKSDVYAWSRAQPADVKLTGAMLGKALRYCMLRFGKRPHELDRRDICFALGRAIFARYPQ